MVLARTSDVKAVFFDIDGTLISFKQHTMPTSTRQALFALRERGIKLYVATGRSKMMMPFMDQYFSFDGYLTLNGQYCYSHEGVIRKQTIASEQIARLRKLIEQEPFACLFVEEHTSFLNFMDESVQALCRLIDHPAPSVEGLSRLQEDQVIQFVPFLRDEQMDILYNNLDDVVYTRSVDVCLDVMAAGGGKEKGIAKVLENLNIDASQIIAFGDSFNDIGMLSYAGIGVAMGNAQAPVKQIADFVTRSVDEDGIDYALRKLGILP